MLSVTGCAIDKQNAPGLSGPSEFSLSLAITAAPDLITPDAASSITVVARDDQGNPVAGVSLRYRLLTAFGTLSVPEGATDGGGVAGFTYFSPSAGGIVDTLVTIEITPVGSNAQNLRSRTVAVRVRS
jgi:hypothetical protein